MNGYKHEIVSHIGTISAYRVDDTSWRKELNVVAWNGRPPKVDIRDWTADHKTMSKGITMTMDDALNLYKLLGALFGEKIEA